MMENDRFRLRGAPGPDQPRVRINFHSFAAKNIFQFTGRVGIHLAQQVHAPLDQAHFDSEAGKELRELHRHRPAAEHDQGRRKLG